MFMNCCAPLVISDSSFVFYFILNWSLEIWIWMIKEEMVTKRRGLRGEKKKERRKENWANFSFPRKRCHPNSLDGHSVSLSIKCLRPKNEPPKQIGNADQLFVEYQTNDLSHAKLKWKSVWFLRWFIMTRRLKIRCEVILIWNVAISSNVVMIVMKYYLQFHCWHFCRSVAGSKSRNLIR